MSIKDFIQLVEQADIPNMQILGPLDDGFAHIQYNSMTGVLDQQANKMILISPKVPNSFQIVTVINGRETTDYIGGNELGPATKKALDSITPRQRPRPPAPLPVQESYESTEQVRSIVQRMMEDARVPQKPRQGPLRPQTGAGKHKDKKKDQKQGKTKHKGKNLDENNIPFAGLGKHKIGQAGQLRSPGPTGYPKGKLVGGAAESRFGRNRDDQFSLGGRLERDNDFRNRERNAGVEHERNNYQVSINGKPWKVFADQRQAMNIARSLRMKGKEVEVYPTGANPSESVGEAVKKPNATTRHLRDYPVSDKDVAKPVKKPEKKKPEQGVAEGSDKLQGTPVVSLADLGDKDNKKNRYGQTVPKKLKKDDSRVKFHKDEKQGVAEGSGKNVVKSVKVGNFRHDLVDTGMGWQVRIYNGDELYDTGMSKNSEQKGLAALEDAVAYTEKQTRTKRQGVAEGWGFDQWGHDTWTDAQKEVARKKKYEMMMRNGQVKKFVAKDDADAKRIAAGHGAKSVIRLRGGVPAGKVAEGERKLGPAPGQSTPNQAERAKSRDHQRTDAAKKARDASQRKGLKQDKDGTYYAKEGVAEEKQKGVDGKACWKGYKRMGTKKKGGKTVDNCVKMESISEGILSSFGLMEKSPPGFKGTVKAMKKHPELTKGKTKDGKEKNPFALAWHMKNKGYKSHKKADGSDKD